MGKTADLTAVQRTIIDTLHQEGKTQKDISQRASCSQSAVSKQATSELKTTEEASDLGYGKEAPDSCRVVQSPLFRRKQVFIWKSRRQRLEKGWRGAKSKLLEIQCEVPTVSDGLGSHVSCWCWSTVFHQVQSKCSCVPRDFRALHASVC